MSLTSGLEVRRYWMELKVDEGLKALLGSGKEKGYLTYGQVNDYLPDDAVNPEKLDQLLLILEEHGIELIDESEAEEREAGPATGAPDDEVRAELDLSFIDDEDSRRIDDPVRMYLTQMGEIPLLKREQEIALAKKIEVTRKRFRRKVLECDGALNQVVETLKRVHSGDLPFDRTVKVSLTENLEKDKIMARMPHNLRTLEHLMEQNQEDFARVLHTSTSEYEQAKRELSGGNLRLVVSIAKKYRNRGLSFLDLIQEGNTGLMRAVDKYEYRRGYKFSTYATWWIRQAITRAIADQARTIRIPVHMIETMSTGMRIVRA